MRCDFFFFIQYVIIFSTIHYDRSKCFIMKADIHTSHKVLSLLYQREVLFDIVNNIT